jgi:small GTP-binding protein
MVSLYYRDAAAAIICYDLTDEKSFNSVHFWINEMINNNDKEDFVMVLAGNKCDIDSQQRKITKAMADGLCEKHQMIQSETSAKTGDGIQELFK